MKRIGGAQAKGGWKASNKEIKNSLPRLVGDTIRHSMGRASATDQKRASYLFYS